MEIKKEEGEKRKKHKKRQRENLLILIFTPFNLLKLLTAYLQTTF